MKMLSSEKFQKKIRHYTGQKSLIENFFPINFVNKRVLSETYHRKPVYNIHRWWAKRPGTTFRSILLGAFFDETTTIEEFRQLFYQRINLNGKIVLDPMAGGGTTLVEANRLGCKVIGVDLNPVAWFIMKKELEPVDLQLLRKEFKKIEAEVASKIRSYYTTICPQCGEDADIVYTFWVKKVSCSNCSFDVHLFPSFRLTERKWNGHTYIWVFCPSCHNIFNTKQKKEVICLSCGYSFDVEKGYSRLGFYTCPHCGNKKRITENLERMLELEMFAIEYYCHSCNGKAYKNVDDYDIQLYEYIKSKFAERKRKLLFPRQKIPDGKEVKRLFNYNYVYFHQFFNERQLLCLSILFKAILNIKDDNLREYLILAFSECLDTNNLFARYNQKASKIEPMFAHHAFYPKNMPAENNVWGTKFGRGSFIKCFNKLLRGKRYCANPYELRPSKKRNKKIYIPNDSIEGKFAENFEGLANGEDNVLLKCQSSESLEFIPEKSVDAVITDPPYYDNVMYSELADFYYVWLRLALKERYSHFMPDYSPRTGEIVVNKAQMKSEKYFLEVLTKVFKECYRVLKDEGLLIFTFHHKKDEAWASVLKAVLDSDFHIVSVFPVHSEMRTSFHIHKKKAIRYDTVVVCRKRLALPLSSSWENLLEEIFSYAEQVVQESLRYENVLKEDILVIAKGKCLELYSKYYPNISKDGEKVSIFEAINEINLSVSSLLERINTRLSSDSLDKYLKSG